MSDSTDPMRVIPIEEILNVSTKKKKKKSFERFVPSILVRMLIAINFVWIMQANAYLHADIVVTTIKLSDESLMHITYRIFPTFADTFVYEYTIVNNINLLLPIK